MTAGEVIRDLEATGVRFWLEGDRVRWRRRARVPLAILAAAREHRDAIRKYLARCCEACGAQRAVMVLMDADHAPWWICTLCYRGDQQRIKPADLPVTPEVA